MNLSQFEASPLSSSPHFLLVGNPVGHSLSPVMHNTAAKHYHLPVRYYAVELQEKELPYFSRYLNNEQLKGVNVTIPFKQAMMDYVNELDPVCRQTGALNTIVKKDQRLAGYNTDVYGFCQPLQRFTGALAKSRAIVFGTGGVARAIAFGLMQIGVKRIILVSRHPQQKAKEDWPTDADIISYDEWPSYAGNAGLLVNATPLGMDPHENGSPVNASEAQLLAGKICYDVVYSPLKTCFLKQAASAGARTIGGLEMLIHQGSRSFKLWTGHPFPVQIIRKKLNQHLRHGN